MGGGRRMDHRLTLNDILEGIRGFKCAAELFGITSEQAKLAALGLAEYIRKEGVKNAV